MGFTPVKPFYHASRTKDGGRAKAYRSIALLRSLACLLGRCFWPYVNCTSELPLSAVSTFNSRGSCGFVVSAVMTHVIVVGMLFQIERRKVSNQSEYIKLSQNKKKPLSQTRWRNTFSLTKST